MEINELRNKSQREIEELFNEDNAREELMLMCDSFYQNLDVKYIKLMSDIVGSTKRDIVNHIFIDILAIIGNVDNGSIVCYNKEGKEVPQTSIYAEYTKNQRDINIHSLLMSIARMKSLDALKLSSLEKCDLAMNIVADYDTILWDLHKKKKHLENNTFTTVTYARVGIKFNVDATLLAQFTRFRLPMIEEPDEWHQGLKGGYQLNKRKITTNKGEGDQPERVCKVLNMLQSQPFYLREHVDSNAEKEMLFEKFKSEGYSPVEALEITKNITVTASDTYQFLEGRPFYFEWRYDFRGRLYSTGYDVNLQSSKYKKGSIQYRW